MTHNIYLLSISKAIFTAEFIESFNKLFDILNSSTFYNSDPNKIAFTNSDEQRAFLNQIKEFLQCINVLNKDGKNITGFIKSLKCWKCSNN